MDGQQIRSLARESSLLDAEFRGVFRRDELETFCEQLPNFPSGGYLINTSQIMPGEHWVCLYKSAESVPLCVFFDPMGYPPSFYDIKLPLNQSIVFNDRQLQPVGTMTCGLYCLFFLHRKASGATLVQIVDSFDPVRLFRNEDIVFDFASALADGKLK